MGRWFEDIDLSSIAANLAWRKKATLRAAQDVGYRREVRWQCARDMTYYLNGWCWLHEPRIFQDENGKVKPHKIPFLTREHQDRYIDTIEARLGLRSIGILKCRDEGFSWIIDYFALRDFTFKRGVDIGLGSSSEKKSDLPGFMGSMLPKIDWAIAQQPKWFLGPKGKRRGEGNWFRDSGDHCFIHNIFGNSITGYAATGEGPRSGRYTWYAFDEFGTNEWQIGGNDRKALQSVGAATQSKVYISTPEGESGEFYRIMTEDAAIVKIKMNWRDNKEKARGLYKYNGGHAVAVDRDSNPLAPEYDPPTPEVKDRWDRLRRKGFTLDNEDTRSPWYDNECDQPEATPEMIAKNVDAKFGGSATRPFDDHFFTIVNETVKHPVVTGRFTPLDDDKWEFIRDRNGDFVLWCPLDAQNRPPHHQYGVSLDFSQGRGGVATSNSALEIINFTTKEQVGEFVSNAISPEEFTDIGIAVCHWFWGAYLSWESNGPGSVAAERIREAGYGHYYERKRHDRTSKREMRVPGFLTNDKTKPVLFADLRLGVKTGDLIIRSIPLRDECSQYIIDGKTGKIEHSAEGAGHGDRVIALGVGRQAMKDRPVIKAKAKSETTQSWMNEEPPRGTLAHVLWQQHQSSQKRNVWDHRSGADMAQRTLQAG
jgi:hypothetical protein